MFLLIFLILAPGRTVANPADPSIQRFQQETQRREDIRQELDSLKSKLAETQQAAISYSAKISEDNTRIQNLADLMQVYRLAEKDITEAAGSTLDMANKAAQATRDQIDNRIRLTEQDLLHTREQLASWSSNIAYNIQRSQIENWRNLVNTQEQQLALLRSQTAGISAGLFQQTLAINANIQIRQAAIYANERAIQRQIESLRAEILQLQNERDKNRATSLALGEQLRQAEQSFSEQDKKVKALEMQ